MPEDFKYFFEREDNKELVSLSYDELNEKREYTTGLHARSYVVCDDGVRAFKVSPDKDARLNYNLRKSGIDELIKENVRYSYSLGCRPSQLKEMQKLHPGAKFVKRGHGYVMEIKNRQEKLQRMKERGFVEFGKNDLGDK